MLQVLIVDDMDIVRIELKRLKLWERNGFVVSGEAKNGQDALEKLADGSFDIVITDIRMPKVDGIELLGKIREKRLCQCVILCSDHSEFKYARQGLVLGAFDYIVKPVVEEELEKLLHRAREYILEKRLEEEKLLKLEKSLEEKLDVFFPQAEVDRLTASIIAGDRKVSQYAGNIIDIAGKSLKGDVISLISLLNGVLRQIKNRMQEKYVWLEKFMGTEETENRSFSGVVEASVLREDFVLETARLTRLMERLKPAVQGSDMVEQVCSHVLEHVDEELSLSKVSEALFLNKSYISANFKQKTGISFVEYLTTVKMERAKKLIGDGSMRVYEAGELLGFRDSEYFSRLFKKYTGVSPSEYRQDIQKSKN